MNHNFNVAIATQYGIEKAILLDNIYFWVAKNKANNINYYDGYFWTYNTAKAWAELFPYMTQNKIQKLLKSMESDGLLVSGNYNKLTYDRTKWYAVTQLAESLINPEITHSAKLRNGNSETAEWKQPNCGMETAKRLNGNSETAEPIPDINTYINTDINTDKESGSTSPPTPPIELGEAVEVVIYLPLNDKTEYPVTKEQCQEWAGLYPAVDAIQQLRNMRGWLLSNPTKRKTRRGIQRFITNWLGREQDRGGLRTQNTNSSKLDAITFEEE